MGFFLLFIDIGFFRVSSTKYQDIEIFNVAINHMVYYLYNLLFLFRTHFMSIWDSGILLYEMLYGRTPFRGKNRQKTFANILHKDLTFPSSIPVKS